MSHKLIIITEIVPHCEDDAKRVKREFISDLIPISKSHLKLLCGPPRFITASTDMFQSSLLPSGASLPVERRFEAVIEAEAVSYFPEENTITIVFYDLTSYLNKKIKVSTVVEDYLKHGWELVP